MKGSASIGAAGHFVELLDKLGQTEDLPATLFSVHADERVEVHLFGGRLDEGPRGRRLAPRSVLPSHVAPVRREGLQVDSGRDDPEVAEIRWFHDLVGAEGLGDVLVEIGGER